MAYEGPTLILGVINTVTVIGAAIWAYMRFKIERTHAAQIEFLVDAKFHGPSKGEYVAEYIFTFENKGKVRVEIDRIELRVRVITADEPLMEWEENKPRLLFPGKIMEVDNVIPESSRPAFFEPGVTQEYRYISKISDKYQFMLINGKFFYKDEEFHTAERVVTIGPPDA